MLHTALTIDGMSCGHCVSRVSKALGAIPGVVVERVEVGHAELDYDPARVTPAQIATALEDAGYPAIPEGESAGH